jgi:hypothetical protein
MVYRRSLGLRPSILLTPTGRISAIKKPLTRRGY